MRWTTTTKTLGCANPLCFKRSRPGMTLLECMVAMILLSSAFAIVLRFQSKTLVVHLEQCTQAKIFQAIVSARERIGAWNLEEITVESIQSMPMNEELLVDNEQPRWVASVVDVEEPIQGKKVTIGIQFNRQTPVVTQAPPVQSPLAAIHKLEFWVPTRIRESENIQTANNLFINDEATQ